MTLEIILMWATLTAYVASTIMYAFGVILGKEALSRWALYSASAGLATQVAAIAVRWVRLGHGPYIGYYELAVALTIFTMIFFVVSVWRNPRLGPIGLVVMPVVVLMLGAAMLASKADFPLTPSLASYWLFIHVIFANVSFAAFVISFGFAVVYVIREKSHGGIWFNRLEKLPPQDIVDDLVGRFVLIGFLLWGIMIVSGAIWAEESWGRYWSWDPIETWSLIVWIIYAIYLHLRYMRRWRGVRAAWFAMALLPLTLFCLVGIPTVFHSIHAGYIGGMESPVQ